MPPDPPRKSLLRHESLLSNGHIFCWIRPWSLRRESNLQPCNLNWGTGLTYELNMWSVMTSNEMLHQIYTCMGELDDITGNMWMLSWYLFEAQKSFYWGMSLMNIFNNIFNSLNRQFNKCCLASQACLNVIKSLQWLQFNIVEHADSLLATISGSLQSRINIEGYWSINVGQFVAEFRSWGVQVLPI